MTGGIDILMRRSVDGGQTFAEPVQIADVPGPKTKNPVAAAKNLGKADEVTYNNPVMIAEPDGRLHLLFCLEYFRCFLSHSDDDGVTWSPVEEITKAFEAFRPEYDWKVLATGPGHGVAMQSGRLVVPVWLSTGTGGHAHRPSSVSVIVSDDHGQNWMRGPIIVPTTDQTPNPSEPWLRSSAMAHCCSAYATSRLATAGCFRAARTGSTTGRLQLSIRSCLSRSAWLGS